MESVKNNCGINEFTEEYNEIVKTLNDSVIIQTEWQNEGDVFTKFSMYDNSYTTIQTFGNTTLINNL